MQPRGSIHLVIKPHVLVIALTSYHLISDIWRSSIPLLAYRWSKSLSKSARSRIPVTQMK